MTTATIKSNEIVTLEIMSWAGISIGAEHVYGYLNYYDADGEYKKDKVTFPMSQEEADALNKKDGFGSNWKAGEPSDRYMDKDTLRADAIKLFCTKLGSQGYKMLVEGNFAVAQPQPVIANAVEVNELANLFNELYDKGNTVGWSWEKDFDLLDNLCAEWGSHIVYEQTK